MTFNLYKALTKILFNSKSQNLSHFLIQNLSLLQGHNDIYYITVCNNKPAEFTIYGSSPDKGLKKKSIII